MPVTSQLLPVAFSLGSVFTWGTSDFLGGYSVRRANAFQFTTVAHASGTLFMAALALMNRSAFPCAGSVRWGLAAGLCGGAALAIFYRALASGRMGLAAPVAAVVSAGIPTIFAMFTEGLPGRIQIVGFLFAGMGIWLISRPENQTRPEGLGLAIIAAIGFAGYFLCVKQAGNASATWTAAIARSASFALTGVIVLISSNLRKETKRRLSGNNNPNPSLARNAEETEMDAAQGAQTTGTVRLNPGSTVIGLLAGCLDVSGSALFIRASQAGRLDVAVVIGSLYPAITVLLARLILHEHFSRWRSIGMLAALIAVPMIAAS
jgi:drug/metabolite transporter (DMT)-like permease